MKKKLYLKPEIEELGLQAESDVLTASSTIEVLGDEDAGDGMGGLSRDDWQLWGGDLVSF